MENFVLNNKNRSELCRLMLNQKIQATDVANTLRGDALIYIAVLDYRIRGSYDVLLSALDVRDGFVIPADASVSKDVDIVPVLQTMINIIDNDIVDSNVTVAFVDSAEKVSKRLQQSSDKMLRSISVSIDVITSAMNKEMPSCLSPDNLSPEPAYIPPDIVHTICPFDEQMKVAEDSAAKRQVQPPQQKQRAPARRHKARQFNLTTPKAIVAPRTFIKADGRYVRRCLSIVDSLAKNNECLSEPMDEGGKCALSHLSRLYSLCLSRVTQKRDICAEARDRILARLLEMENISQQASNWMDKRPVYTHRIVPQHALKTRDKLIKK